MDSVIKYNKTTKKDWCKYMHNYTENKVGAEVNSAFEKDIETGKLNSLENEIIKICSEDNLLKSSEFERLELAKSQELIEKINSFDINNFLQNGGFPAENFVKEINESSLEFIKNIKSLKLKLSVLNNVKKHELKEFNLTKAVNISIEISKLEREIDSLNKMAFDNCSNLLNQKLMLINKYIELLNLVLDEDNMARADNVPNQIKNAFFAKKCVYLIKLNLGSVPENVLINLCENSNKIKIAFENFYDEFISELRLCGNKL